MSSFLNSSAIKKMVQTVRQEHPTIDFKVTLHLDDQPVGARDRKIKDLKDVRQAEFARDLMALANLVWPSTPLRYILIGIDDNARVVGTEPERISETDIRDAVNRFCSPPVNWALHFVNVDERWIGVIEILDSLLKPHRMKQRVVKAEWRDRQRTSAVPKKVYRKGTVYTRRGSHVHEATSEEEQLMEEYVANQSRGSLAGRLLVEIERYIAERRVIELPHPSQSRPELHYPPPTYPPLVPSSLSIGQKVRLRLFADLADDWADPKGSIVEILGQTDQECQRISDYQQLEVINTRGEIETVDSERWHLCVPSYLIDAEWRRNPGPRSLMASH